MAKTEMVTADDLGVWRRLYELAQELLAAAPWKVLREDDIFAIDDPESGERGFVSVMGAGGQYRSIAVYRGVEGLFGFWNLLVAEDDGSPEMLLEIPQLQLSFGSRRDLERHDREVVRQLGMTFKVGAHPQFRSGRPGYMPWILEAAEMSFMACMLEQTLALLPRLPQALPESEGPGGPYLLRTRRGEAWAEETTRVPPPPPRRIAIEVEGEIMRRIEPLATSGSAFEADFFISPAIVAPKGERPHPAYVLLVVDSASTLVVGVKTFSPAPNLEAMWGSVAAAFLEVCAAAECLPARLTVRTQLLRDLLAPMIEPLGIDLHRRERLRALDPARRSLEASLGG